MLKSRKRSLASKIESVEKKLAKMGPENKELVKTTTTLKDHRNEMEQLTRELMNEEAAIGDFKRRTVKEAMGLKCGGLLELAEKITIIAEMGKMIIDEIPLESTQPGHPRAAYQNGVRTEQLLQEATRCIADVGFAPSGPSSGAPRPDLSHMDTGLQGIDDSLDNTGIADDYNDHQRYDEQEGSQAEQQTRGQDGYGYDDRAARDDEEDTYAGAGNSYSAAADYNTAIDYNTTPIYATHATTSPWLKDQSRRTADGSYASGEQPSSTDRDEQHQKGLQTEGLHDQAAEDWRQNVANTMAAGGSHHDHSLPQPPHSFHDDGGIDTPTTPTPGLPMKSSTPPTATQPISTAAGAPSLPPLRASSPLPSEAAEDPYFAAVGSTRAAQAAARRPTSPAMSNGPSSSGANRWSGQANSSLGAVAASSASTYEPSETGRKTTAAAFRKGFARVPSSQHTPTLDSGAGSSYGPAGPRESPGSPAGIAPLAIRKRHSALYDADAPHEDEVAPPYNPRQNGTSTGQHSQSDYNEAYDDGNYGGGGGGYGQQQNYYAAVSPGIAPVPGGYVSNTYLPQNGVGSRPTSAMGHQQQQQQQQPSSGWQPPTYPSY